MNSTMVEKNEMKAIWSRLCNETIGSEIEQSAIWKLLKSQYRMLLIQKWVTSEQVDVFNMAVARFKKMTDEYS